ncbi:MAG: L,D-transpeptidase family protein [Lentisphaerae bacterium]|jgi:lipoprotein-anchoring transpeptidase ErfK/SrfK|nr:L,D-transpeptidase family protein [Lentisphaerota bacterium]
MKMYDIEDYYRPKRFPWLPVTIISVFVIGALTAIFSSRNSDKSDEIKADEKDIQTSSSQADQQDEAPVQPPVTYSRIPEKPLAAREANALISEAVNLKKAGRLEEARNKFLSILNKVDATTRAVVEREIGELSIELFTSPRPMKGKAEYIVKSGDSLSVIASRFECPVELIQKSNNIKDRAKIQIGQRLVIPDHPKFSILVSKTGNTLTLLLNREFFKTYPVGTGVQSKTPAGTFKIVEKISEPPWWPGDGRASIPYGSPDNILGTRWLALEATGDTPKVRGYGIHGTWDNSTIGKQSSAGCVRMKNTEVEEVFMLVPRGTPVTIVE